MKIYQVHDMYGDFEDFSDDIIATYDNYESAKKHLDHRELIEEQNEEQVKICGKCHDKFIWDDDDS